MGNALHGGSPSQKKGDQDEHTDRLLLCTEKKARTQVRVDDDHRGRAALPVSMGKLMVSSTISLSNKGRGGLFAAVSFDPFARKCAAPRCHIIVSNGFFTYNQAGARVCVAFFSKATRGDSGTR